MALTVLRPNGVGDYTNINNEYPAGAAHWSVVDEATPDDADYVYQSVYNASPLYDVYTLEDTSLLGAITSVTVYFKVWSSADETATATPRFRLGTSETTGTAQTLTTTKVTYSEILTRPGGGSWAWTDINSLQAGIGLYMGALVTNPYCSHLYLYVQFTEEFGDQIIIMG